MRLPHLKLNLWFDFLVVHSTTIVDNAVAIEQSVSFKPKFIYFDLDKQHVFPVPLPNKEPRSSLNNRTTSWLAARTVSPILG